MTRLVLFLLFLSTINCSVNAQLDLSKYLGGWSGELPKLDQFIFNFQLDKTIEGSYKLQIDGLSNTNQYLFRMEIEDLLVAELPNDAELKIDLSGPEPIGFLRTGHHLCFLSFNQSEGRPATWYANWNLLLAAQFDPTFYLSIDEEENGHYSGSSFLQSPLCHYMFGQDFVRADDYFSFKEIRSGIQCTGKLKGQNQLQLSLEYWGEVMSFDLERLDYDEWKIGSSDLTSLDRKERISVLNPSFELLVNDLETGTFPGTHSVLIDVAGQNQLTYYAGEFTENVIHDTRSLSKSFAAMAIGLAIEDGYLKGENQSIQPLFAEQYPDIDWSGGKSAISLHHLMTMSSGLDAIDFGLNRMSYANEGAYQNEEDWTAHILSAPMINQPGLAANYGSGNPHLLGAILENILEEGLEFYLHKRLFAPLGITNYRLQTDARGQVYCGGGWFFRPMDLAKVAQLMLQEGSWEGGEILPKEWVKKCSAKYLPLLNANDQNDYGYLFWHKTYMVGEQIIESYEGRGAGGQYMFIIPELSTTIVITSGNYRSGNPFLPEDIVEKRILPLILAN